MDTYQLHTIPEVDNSEGDILYGDESDEVVSSTDSDYGDYSTDYNSLKLDSESENFSDSSTISYDEPVDTKRSHTKHKSSGPRYDAASINSSGVADAFTTNRRIKSDNSNRMDRTVASMNMSSINSTIYNPGRQTQSHTSSIPVLSSESIFSNDYLTSQNRQNTFRLASPVSHYSPQRNDIFDSRQSYSVKSTSQLPDLPSPVTQNIDEITNAERRFSEVLLTKTEIEEYYALAQEYSDNERLIPNLKEKVYQTYCEYEEMMKQNCNDIINLKQKEEKYIESYKVKELTDMRKEYINVVIKRQTDIASQIEDKFEKPVEKMCHDTVAIIQNMNRSFIGKIVFAIVWILEYVWNWLKEEWMKVSFNIQQEQVKPESVRYSEPVRYSESVHYTEPRNKKEKRSRNSKRRNKKMQ